MILADYVLSFLEDGVLSVTMVPPTNITFWSIQFQLMKRFDSNSPLEVKSVASGFNNASGINIINGPGGQFYVNQPSLDVSGLPDGAYAYSVRRTDPGFAVGIMTGYRLSEPQ